MNGEIREPTTADAGAYRACIDSVAREGRFVSWPEAPPLDAIVRHLRRVATGEVVGRVACDADRVVGWCEIAPSQRQGQSHVGSLSMGVSHSHRGQGIGRRLASAALAGAWALGLERVELEVFASNVAARGLYTRLRFDVEGVKRRARKVGDDYDDIVLMARVHVPPVGIATRLESLSTKRGTSAALSAR